MLLSGSEIQRTWGYSFNIPSVSSVDPPSITMCSKSRNDWLATDSTVSRRNRPWFSDGVTTLIRGRATLRRSSYFMLSRRVRCSTGFHEVEHAATVFTAGHHSGTGVFMIFAPIVHQGGILNFQAGEHFQNGIRSEYMMRIEAHAFTADGNREKQRP